MQAEIRDALNEHLKLELQAWYDYTAMALWFVRSDLPGFAAFMRRQADEEFLHARKIMDHLMERDELPVLARIEGPRLEWDSVQGAFEHVLKAEQNVSASIHKLYKLAEKKDDQAARIMLAWFITEQVEEENMARSLLGRLKIAGTSGPGLLLLDQELGKPPAQ
jgi:ferritin